MHLPGDRSIRMDLKCETYSPTHLKALKKLRSEYVLFFMVQSLNVYILLFFNRHCHFHMTISSIWISSVCLYFSTSVVLQGKFFFVRCEILEKIQQRELESADVEHQLEMYKSLGSEFEAIANEYGTANSNIEKQLWALNEIKQNLNKVPD